jgi:hypothetical protein
MNGYVKSRRGIVDHITCGTLNAIEFAIFQLLVLLADSSTGSHTINSAVLRSCYFPEMARDTAQRSLVSLEEKGFIFRLNPASCKRAYRYWVNKYEATTGPNAMRRTDLSQVFESNNISDLKWVDLAAEIQTDVQTGMLTGIPTSYQERRKKKEEKGAERFVLPGWVPQEQWDAWEEMRRKKKKIPTDYARRLAVKELEKLRAGGSDPGAVLDQSTSHCWTDLYAVKGRNGNDDGRVERPADKTAYQDPTTVYDSLKSAPRRTA